MLLAAILSPDPIIFLEPKRIYRLVKQEVPDNGVALPLEKAFVLREGSDVTLISWGASMHETQQAAEALAQEGISAEIIDVASIKPLDTATIINSLNKTGRCVIVHEAAKSGGIGAEIAAQIGEKALLSLLAPIQRVTGYDTVMPYFKLEKSYIPSVARIIHAAKLTLEFS